MGLDELALDNKQHENYHAVGRCYTRTLGNG